MGNWKFICGNYVPHINFEVSYWYKHIVFTYIIMETPVVDTSDVETPDNIRLQRSKQLYGCYVEHITTLHGDLTGDLEDMTDALDVEKLKKIIVGFENIIGMLLNVE